MKTLFISRLDHATTEADLKAEFSRHGPIRSISLIKDLAGRSRGYAFIEYEHTGDMKAAYKAYPPDGFVRIGNSQRLSLVDVERGRTVPDWCVREHLHQAS
jgi:U1 small nuclear ribonucleoprotein